jgi:hypothetical protein
MSADDVRLFDLEPLFRLSGLRNNDRQATAAAARGARAYSDQATKTLNSVSFVDMAGATPE